MRIGRLRSGLLVVLLVGSLAAVACSPSPPFGGQASAAELRSKQPRIATEAPEEDLRALTDGNTAFALDLYRALVGQDNLFFSPHSISLALAMTYAGAASTTAEQMGSTLHFTLPDERLHAAFNTLDARLARRNQSDDQDATPATAFTLRQANALWGQRDYPFRPTFLDLLAQHYGAGLRVLDFSGAPEPARTHINGWVAEQTERKIQDLLPGGSITFDTRLVLTNAIYFKAKWITPFDSNATRDGPFTRLNGETITTPLMNLTSTFPYAEGTDYQAIQMDYHGDAALVVLLPAAGTFQAFEAALTAERLREILDGLEPRHVVLTLPKLNYTSPSVKLRPALEGLGMTDAFAEGTADFSGMDGTRKLFVSDVHHKATLIVDEEGTEAAAASAAVMQAMSAQLEPPTEMRVDRPFILLIRDQPTGAILFAGRIVDPRSQ